MVLRLPDSWSNWNLEMLVFEERGKPEYPEKNLSEQGREPTTNSTHMWRRRRDLNPGHIGGRRVFSPLRHPCSPYKLTWSLPQAAFGLYIGEGGGVGGPNLPSPVPCIPGSCPFCQRCHVTRVPNIVLPHTLNMLNRNLCRESISITCGLHPWWPRPAREVHQLVTL